MAGRDIVCFVWLVRLMCRGVLRRTAFDADNGDEKWKTSETQTHRRADALLCDIELAESKNILCATQSVQLMP